MAVYTKLNQKKIEQILSNYNLGKLDSFKGIEEGIENTNYFLSVNKKKFILTIYEKRVKSKDLPFFSDLMSSLNKAGFKCPTPVTNKKNETLTDYEGTKLMIVSFLEGKAKKNLYRLKKLNILKKIILFKGEATNLKFCQYVLNSKINEIYYLAGDSSVIKSFLTPNISLKSNAEGIINILQILKKKKYKARLFNAGSGQFYGDNKNNKYNKCNKFH